MFSDGGGSCFCNNYMFNGTTARFWDDSTNDMVRNQPYGGYSLEAGVCGGSNTRSVTATLKNLPTGWKPTKTWKWDRISRQWSEMSSGTGVINTIAAFKFPRSSSACGMDKEIMTELYMFGITEDLQKTCSVQAVSTNISAGQPVQASLWARSLSSSSDPSNLYIAKSDYTRISPAPAGTTELAYNGRYYYIAASCNTSQGQNCTAVAEIPDLAPGDYYLHCDLPNDPQKCSGNPNCTYEGGSVDCTSSGWQSCSDYDNLLVSITPETISGNVYVGEGSVSGNYCVATSATQGGLPNDSAITITPDNNGTTYSNSYSPGVGTYNATVKDGDTYSVSFNPGTHPNAPDKTYAFSCPSAGSYANVPPGASNVNFFVQEYDLSHVGWWQAAGV